jgi:L-asparaginase
MHDLSRRPWRAFATSIAILLLAVAAPAQAAAKPTVVILATGGTIAGTGDDATTTVGYTASTVGVDALIKAVPALREVANVRGEQVFQIASESMTPDHWLALARRVDALLADKAVDGVVVTHGTDTIEETAYFLHLTVHSAKPVVVVGAMRPSTAMSADGPLNLYNAVILAGSREAVGKGVLVAMNDQISSARDVSKTNVVSPDTFKAPELGLLGYVKGGKPYFYRTSTRRHTMDSEFSLTAVKALPAVDIVYAYAGIQRAGLDGMLAGGARGIIHAGTGDGSTARAMKPALAEARKQGTIIVRATRAGQGRVARNGEVNDDAEDFVTADTLNPQKARVLLMLGLTKTTDTAELQRMFDTY